MSTIKVEVVEIQDVRPHPNADALELATLNGWQACVRKGAYKTGDAVVYFEQGTQLPRVTTDAIDVTKYLSEKTNIDGERVLVVHRIKLRGEPSFGLVVAPEPGMVVGQDVAAHYGATKFEPPIKVRAGDAEVDHPFFPRYTDMENMRSYPAVLNEGEQVVATEKIHGSNCRVAFVVEDGHMVFMAGSKTLRRKEPAEGQTSTYWFPINNDLGVHGLFSRLYNEGHKQAVLYGEIYGQGIQSYTYGQRGIAFRAFDLMVDGQYVDYDRFAFLCDEHGIGRVPLIYRGPYTLSTIATLSDGPSILGGNGREGVVVRPISERNHGKVGRVILKYVGDVYLFSKVAEQDTTDA